MPRYCTLILERAGLTGVGAGVVGLCSGRSSVRAAYPHQMKPTRMSDAKQSATSACARVRTHVHGCISLFAYERIHAHVYRELKVLALQ